MGIRGLNQKMIPFYGNILREEGMPGVPSVLVSAVYMQVKFGPLGDERGHD